MSAAGDAGAWLTRATARRLPHRGGPQDPWFSALRKSLREMAERLADKYEEAKEKQEDLTNRLAGGAVRGPPCGD